MTALAQTALGKLLEFLDRLEDAKIDYRLAHIRDSIMVEMVVPGERWEVEFFENGQIAIERFVSTYVQNIDEHMLSKLIEEYCRDE
ncbi:hypothetical protein [Roseiflexus castenholzii]|jgi:hypothetical protein|uniref:Uncharacterized protein n=1 Tax=Roseiflexus castenholzii (strain DSM 13941 / HLO8) TaxID=383372 RepID=A7NPD4_ROSCS|nr:hypothetical protein [Roseiflexus castenholzii]ABU59430.1 hypothetical protein Rcas_3380 [Roseiflexus castenholzii DSM 13941]